MLLGREKVSLCPTRGTLYLFQGMFLNILTVLRGFLQFLVVEGFSLYTNLV